MVEAILQSPHLLYRIEAGADGQPLSGYEMATKVSYLLRNAMPDQALIDAAGEGADRVAALTTEQPAACSTRCWPEAVP